ncbi:hypothetical protein [Halobacterium salinarum]|uniref:hypothetical protein n=1 Tax=Halobacterium salinarum TaxID=2242 RepID=UPI0006777FA5|nr:hypothetical protein [Halobacterium salinarum]
MRDDVVGGRVQPDGVGVDFPARRSAVGDGVDDDHAARRGVGDAGRVVLDGDGVPASRESGGCRDWRDPVGRSGVAAGRECREDGVGVGGGPAGVRRANGQINGHLGGGVRGDMDVHRGRRDGDVVAAGRRRGLLEARTARTTNVRWRWCRRGRWGSAERERRDHDDDSDETNATRVGTLGHGGQRSGRGGR